MLKVSNVSLNIILREVYNHSERTIDILPQILKINEGKPSIYCVYIVAYLLLHSIYTGRDKAFERCVRLRHK